MLDRILRQLTGDRGLADRFTQAFGDGLGRQFPPE
jgi:hypothetical protein